MQHTVSLLPRQVCAAAEELSLPGKIFICFAAFCVGMGFSFINHLITKAVLKGGSAAFVMPLRIIISAAYIAALYFIGAALGLPVLWLLTGGALGLTVGMVLSAAVLMRGSK